MINVNKSAGPFSLILVLLSLLASSCSDNSISFNEEIPGGEWSRYNIPRFEAGISDTLNTYDILISLRNSYNYPYRNIFLFVKTVSPRGYSIKDTLEYQLADESGKWYGRGLGDIHNISLPYKSNVLFPDTGTYIFSIEQGMRQDKLEGIIDVGMIIRKAE
ncbi:MAG: gliding motility lipoprotein GldH [Marinilabiliaceae bacterium]|jgi:gliding motility-associated lipoprotein GldH|nr:gliding motility lipoprotein GldH [Marinilabiliaceae bacterium]